MENASKALIIAGAILLSIAIIGVGMMVFQGVSETITGANLGPEEIDAYNREFRAYEGNQRGTQVRALCDRVSNHNRLAEDPSELIRVIMGEAPDDLTAPAVAEEGETGTTVAEINTVKSGILSGKTYTVTCSFDNSSGLVTQINIVEVTQ